ncbi:oligopeptide ABC transporter substrate-binding protein [Oceanobacillus picturae]|uniref:oligopeptide ABC transporter substrate-binding protein n=1 Tax=Oceanobacillus picturae TaxID=171693 RepID=UPI000E69C43B|nr:oligopeptide ABC transporter substrate-binding protein [Oceanobacillus picturae]RIU91152.1 oligopeptide ABC transporter substrate-binding protein [Oceanobacillus picturae]
MTKASWSKALFALMLVLLLALAACNSDSEEGEGDSGSDSGESNEGGSDAESEDGLYSLDDFEGVKTNEGEAIEGGNLNFGLVSESAFEGTLNYNFYSGNPDVVVIEWFDEALLSMDENYNYTNDGAATYETNEEGNEFTFKIRDEVNWHDGEPVTAEDWAYSFEVIGHPEYTGVRYGTDFTSIEGMEAYHNGEADSISGIEVIDEKTLKITYLKANPSLLTGSIWPYAMPKHIFEDIPVAEMAESPEVRENPIGMGPFKVDTIVPGESVTYTKNEDYWRGEPKLDGVTLKVISPGSVVKALETGEVDLVDNFPSDQFPDNADMSNVEYLGTIDLYYNYIGFKLGTWDAEAKEVKPDDTKKMADKNLRQAMAHAIDKDSLGKEFYQGLRWGATTLIPPSHPMYHDTENPGLEFDPEKSKQILDDAGYVDVNDDGFREDPDGEELVINFAAMDSGDISEPMAQFQIQSWEAVGLNVQLLDGRLQEFNSFYDRVGQNGEDDPEVDIYSAAWGVGSDVNPAGLYGRDALFNFPRYASEENDRLLAEGLSEKAFDTEYRQEVYNEWQEFMAEEVPVFPLLYATTLVPVNNRVHNYSIDPAQPVYLNELAVTQEEPIVAE